MFTTTHPEPLLDHLRVPHRSIELDSRSNLAAVACEATGRRLFHPVSDAPAYAPRGEIAGVVVVAPVTAADDLRRLLPGDGWAAGPDGLLRSAGGDVALPFDPGAAMLNLFSEAYAAGDRAQAKRVAMHTYYRVRPLLPRAVQIALRRRFAALQARTVFPRWPVETAAHDLFDLVLSLLGEVAGEPVPWIAAWPDPYRWALVLTHDVEQQAGCDNVHVLGDVEERRGFRSAWNFVPRRYATPAETIADLRARGHEVGVHGLLHDGRDLESRETLLARLPGMREAAERWGASGFRSPATHRAWDLMPLLGFDHDSSYLDTDPFEPQGGGSCTWWPFFIGDLVELPITLLMDHTLFVILRRDEVVWSEKVDVLREREGMALLITHPDYFLEQDRLEIYDRFLARVEDDESMWRALPSEVAAWWRRRGDLAPERANGSWRAPPGARLVLGPLDRQRLGV